MRARLILLTAVAALGLGACTTGSPDIAIDVGDAPLPTLPPDSPGLGEPEVAAQGNGVSAASRAESAAARAAQAGSSETDWRQLAGFEGTRWTQDVTSSVVVLEDTVTVRDGTAVGLVRNEHKVPVGPVTVAANGHEAEVLIPVLRPGEPAPFVMDVGTVEAKGLEWSVRAGQAEVIPSRDVRLATFWSRGVRDPRPADTYLHEDPDEGAHPMVVFGAVEAFEPLSRLRIVGAWIDDDGRLLAVSEGSVANSDLAAGGASDFVVTTHGPPSVDDAHLMLWAWAS